LLQCFEAAALLLLLLLRWRNKESAGALDTQCGMERWKKIGETEWEWSK
jgi:hypothetical protein